MKRLILRYKDLSRWDVKSFLSLNFNDNQDLIKLSKILKSIKKELSYQDIKNYWYKIISKINFWWDLFLRKFEEIEDYKWKLFLVPDDSIIFSKINAKHWCIYYHEKEVEPFAVSNEYPVLKFDSNKIYWKYLKFVLRSNIIKSQLNSKAAWIAKARTNLDDFLSLEIPLPHIDIQKQIVKDYENNKIKAQNLKYEALEKEKNIDDFLMSELGIEKQEQKRKKWPFVVRYKDLENDWWVQKNTQKVQIWKSHIDFIEMWKVCYDFKNWVNFSKEQVWKWTKFVNIKDIYNNWYVDTNKLELVEVSEKEIKNNKVNDNDIIFVRSSVKYEWVAYPSLIDTKWEDIVFCWFLIKASIDTNIINPKYLLYLLRWEIYREKIISTAVKTIITNISQDKLKNLKIPLPTIWDEKTPWTQKYIVSKIDEMKKEIDKLNIEAERLEKEADENLEKTILWV